MLVVGRIHDGGDLTRKKKEREKRERWGVGVEGVGVEGWRRCDAGDGGDGGTKEGRESG
jgi:hypothetical protein